MLRADQIIPCKTVKSQVESSDSEDDAATKCKICSSVWRRTKGKLNNIWRVCELCDKYVCPKCVPRDIGISEEFVWSNCSWQL